MNFFRFRGLDGRILNVFFVKVSTELGDFIFFYLQIITSLLTVWTIEEAKVVASLIWLTYF